MYCSYYQLNLVHRGATFIIFMSYCIVFTTLKLKHGVGEKINLTKNQNKLSSTYYFVMNSMRPDIKVLF